jgi:hypothetical protein
MPPKKKGSTSGSSSGGKGTRLDKLFSLIKGKDTSAHIRKTAAEQIGQVAKLHPHELHPLLSRLKPILVSSNWDARVAAGEAIEALAANYGNWECTIDASQCEQPPPDNLDPMWKEYEEDAAKIFLDFDMFNIGKHFLRWKGSVGLKLW